MGKRELRGQEFTPEPTLTLSKEKKGYEGVFHGHYLGLHKPKPVGQYGKMIHAFAFVDSTLPITILKNEQYIPVEMDKGETVIVFANNNLHVALSKAEKGMLIEIVGLGMQLNPNSGRKFNKTVVNVIE